MSAMTAVAPPVAAGKGGGRSTPTYYRAYSLVAGAALVLAQGHDPVDGLLTALEQPGAFDGEVHGIGDCLAPRTVEEAVLEALKVACAI